jgi:RNA polymerase sigma-70 factor (ECF subfamily)
VAQEAFLKLWRQARKWQPKAQIGTWLRRVAYNACIDRLRKTRPTDDIHDMPLADSAPDPETMAAQADVAAQVKAAIEELPERQRAALVLVHYEGLGNIEAAKVMETTVEAVESLLGRARRALKKSLASLRDEELGEGMEN